MKKNLLTMFLINIALIQSVSASCLTEKSQSCYDIEKHKTDDTRYGVSASAYCSSLAVLECKNSGYNAANNNPPKLKSIDKCSALAEKTGSWNKDVYHNCMDTPDGFKW